MSAYGKCWTCGADVVSRTRGIPSIDTCENGHKNDASLTLRGKIADEIERLREELREARDIMRRVQSLNNAIRNDEGYYWAHASVVDGELSAFLAKSQ